MKIPGTILAAVCAVIISITLSGCSSKPIDELKMVAVAQQQAAAVEASEYAPLDWDRAQMQWQEANALLHLGRYSDARNVLIDAVGSFNIARDKANRRVESLKIEINALQSSSETELKKLERDSEDAKLKPSVRKRIEAALPRIDEKISEMNSAFDAKEYLRSRMAGHALIRYVEDLRKRLGLNQ